VISQKEEMRTGTESSGVVLHIEWIYFYFIIFSQKKMGSKKHAADVVLPIKFFKVIADSFLEIPPLTTLFYEHAGTVHHKWADGTWCTLLIQPRLPTLTHLCLVNWCKPSPATQHRTT
jgi:hypothetical protein